MPRASPATAPLRRAEPCYPPGDYAGEVARRHGVQADDVMGNWLVLTNAQGFVSVIGHPTPDAARAAFAQLEAQWIDWEDQPL